MRLGQFGGADNQTTTLHHHRTDAFYRAARLYAETNRWTWIVAQVRFSSTRLPGRAWVLRSHRRDRDARSRWRTLLGDVFREAALELACRRYCRFAGDYN